MIYFCCAGIVFLAAGIRDERVPHGWAKLTAGAFFAGIYVGHAIEAFTRAN